RNGDLSEAGPALANLRALAAALEPELRSAADRAVAQVDRGRFSSPKTTRFRAGCSKRSSASGGTRAVSPSMAARAGEELQKEEAPRLAILDWMMPEMDGVEVCSKVRERTGSPYVYILLLSAKSQREDLVKGMESGADDYITKPFDANELKVRLRAGRRILDLQTQLMSAQEAMRDQAARDPLTGIWNRKAIFDLFRRELARAEREQNHLGIVMLDIDNFKNLNDTHGHLAGDAVLRE